LRPGWTLRAASSLLGCRRWGALGDLGLQLVDLPLKTRDFTVIRVARDGDLRDQNTKDHTCEDRNQHSRG
jgi:hypothetical protein